MRLSTNDEATTAAAGRDAWSATCDALLAGLAHALSNRVASLNAVAAMSAEGAAEAGLSLDTEVLRLNELLRLLRALAVRPAGRAVALDGTLILAQAVELHGTHATLRDVPVRIDEGTTAPPILAAEGALTRALLLALTGARVAAAARRSGVVARCVGEPGRVAFEIAPSTSDEPVRPLADASLLSADDEPRSAEGLAARALLLSSGGEVHESPGGRYRVVVPMMGSRPAPGR